MNTVLIVEDDLLLLEALKRLLRGMPVQVVGMENAEAAQRWLDEGGTPDVVVADEHLPGMTGCALLEAVARRHPQAARVLHTADDAIVEASQGASYTVLLKPVAPPLFRQIIARVLSRHHQMPNPW